MPKPISVCSKGSFCSEMKLNSFDDFKLFLCYYLRQIDVCPASVVPPKVPVWTENAYVQNVPVPKLQMYGQSLFKL